MCLHQTNNEGLNVENFSNLRMTDPNLNVNIYNWIFDFRKT